jgi:hypothetical protein
MKRFGRLFVLNVCFATWGAVAIVEGCGRSDPRFDVGDAAEGVPDVTMPDGPFGDVRAPDGRIGTDGGGLDVTVLPDVRPDAPDVGTNAPDVGTDAPVADVAVQTDAMHCSPLTACNGVCANTNTDPMNCGTCGNGCSATTPSCLSGACVQTCATDSGPVLTNCDNACVNLQTDPMHCGSCAIACTGGQQCNSGVCGCTAGQTPCNGQCVNVQTDLANCGACGNNCDSMPLPAGATAWSCSGGTCSTTCMSATPTRCPNGSCVDLTNDSANCGTCGNVCGVGAWCVNGACACPAGQAYCNGACVADQTDPNNCGACGHVCGTGVDCSAGTCVCTGGLTHCGNGCIDVLTDNANCGRCDLLCSAGTTCQHGSCQCYNGGRCPPGNVCAQTQSDPSNCGGCGNACQTATPVCNAGVCTVNCDTDSGPALTDCGNGCVDLQTNPSNCGTCGHQCPGGANCVNGTCQCSSADILCAATCVDPTSDYANCGRCGNACAGGNRCSNSKCVPGCGDGGLTMCSPMGPQGPFPFPGFGGNTSFCVDTSTNNANCGSCGTNCPFGGTCTNGTCSCAAGLTQCALTFGGWFLPFAGLGNCTDTQSSNTNCGGCGIACTSSHPLCQSGSCAVSCQTPETQCGTGPGALCANLSNNKNNCGLCGVSCGGNSTCVNGSCTCASPYTDCSGTCTNLKSDNNNCGSCGSVCSSPNTCKSGMCGN